jgi:hypothetical protein
MRCRRRRPCWANLRNLALAEFRANDDSLTGLANKRATDDTLKRMVAQANRSITPLAAAMLDLDHFKQINDRFGRTGTAPPGRPGAVHSQGARPQPGRRRCTGSICAALRRSGGRAGPGGWGT